MASCARSLLSAGLGPHLYRLHPGFSRRHLSPVGKHASVRGARHYRHVSVKAGDLSGLNDSSNAAKPQIRRLNVRPRDEWKSTLRPSLTTQQQHATNAKSPSCLTVAQVLDQLKSTKSMWDSDSQPLISSILLRDACRCDQCIDPSTKQRSFSFQDIPNDVAALQGGKTSDGNFIINWKNDITGFSEHTSTFSLDDLKAIVNGQSTSMIPEEVQAEPWDTTTIVGGLTTMSYEDYMNSDKHLLSFTKALQRDGLVFVKGVPQSSESVSQIVERIGPIRNTFYGSTWDVKSKPKAENVAYTDKELGFHMDLLYMHLAPKYQFLHCLQNSCTGGKSRFLDIRRARQIMEVNHPSQAKILNHVRFRYHYQNLGQAYANTRYVFSKLPEKTWWSPQFVETFMPVQKPGVTIPQALSAVKTFASILDRKDLVYEMKMEEGTCAIFENTRVVHARSAFDVNSGHRWLRGAYLDGQPLTSTYIRLMREKAANEEGMI